MSSEGSELPTLVADDDLDSDPGDGSLEDSLVRAVAAAPAVGMEPLRLAPGTVVDGTYRITGVLGAGAMGVVYEAQDTMLDRRVAVKVHDVADEADGVSRVWREAKAMARLSDPNVITVYEVGWHEGRIFIAMELVEGTNARAWSRERTRRWPEVLDVFIQAARGLAAAHRVGIVHRDFKPDNVLVGRDGRVRVADFGLARAAGEVGPRPSEDTLATSSSPRFDSHLTRTGATLGTPAYMAPEQLLGRAVDARADQFAFCVALHEALYGKRPFQGLTLAEILGAITAGEVHTPSTEGAPPRRVLATLRRGLSRDPQARWPDMETLANALQDDAVRRRRAWLVGVGALVGGLVAWTAGNTDAAPAPCDGAGDNIAASWNDEAKARIGASFAATGVPFSDSAAARTTAALEAWSTTWRDQRYDACVATRVRQDQSEARMEARVDCLERLRVEGEASIEVLATADVDTLVYVDRILNALPDALVCSDPDLVAAGDRVSPSQRTEYEGLHAEFAAATADFNAGRLLPARNAVEDLLPRITSAGFSSLAARTQILLAHSLQETSVSERVLTLLADANASALARGDLVTATDAMLELARVLGRTSAGTEDALRWLQAGSAAAEHPRTPVRLREAIETTRAEILFYGDRAAAAEAATRDSLTRLPSSSPVRVRLLTIRASALERLERFDESLAVHREAVALSEEMRGPDHPIVSSTLGNLVNLLVALGRYEEADPIARRVLAIRERVYGERSAAAAEAHRQIADLLKGAGKMPQAKAEYELALQMHREAGDRAGAIFDAGNLGGVLVALGDGTAALELTQQNLEAAKEVFGADSMRAAQIRINLASILSDADRIEDAIVEGERALASIEKHKPDSLDVAVVITNLASMVARQGRIDEALAYTDRAQRILDRVAPIDAPDFGQVLTVRADILAHAERWPEVHELRAKAVVLFERAHGGEHPDVFEVLYFQGRDLLLNGRATEAVPVLERALSMSKRVSVDPRQLAMVRWRLAVALAATPATRARSRQEGERARDELRVLEDPRADEIETWLRSM